EEQLRDLQHLTHILQNICTTLDVETLLHRMVEEVLELCRADEGTILLLGPESPEEAVTLIRQGEAQQGVLDHYLNELLAGWVAVHLRPLLTNDLPAVLGRRNLKSRHQGITSVLSVPLMDEDEGVMGVINLISLQPQRRFGERERRLLELLSGIAGRLIRNARLHQELFVEARRLKAEVQDRYAVQGIIGRSPGMQKVFAVLDRVIPTDVRVMLEGESGTGKERIARAIHYSGPRKDKPFVAVDCGALPANLLESELFGYVKGAFTGADRDRRGLFEEANGGTLFLDEIANMPQEVQAKFLRAVQEGEIRPLGSSQVRKVDVRIISAASGNLAERVKNGEFRQDLYYRLNVVTVVLPPLRERREDIPLLVNHFLERMNERYNRHIRGIQEDALALLEGYPWPGNVRELEHALERAVVLCEGSHLTRRDFAFLEQENASPEGNLLHPRPLEEAVNDFKRRLIIRTLEQTGGNQTRAAEVLQIQRAYLHRL
ncbi:MAG: sigma-54-dependent Fis family transcriptional regulator, partial [Calditrichaeota bacterium]